MSKVIYKYSLEVGEINEVFMPRHARILSVQIQKGKPVIWALLDLCANIDNRREFVFVATGEVKSDDFVFFSKYIATIQDGKFVWHLFELSRE